jgi:ferrous iron transport protein B
LSVTKPSSTLNASVIDPDYFNGLQKHFPTSCCINYGWSCKMLTSNLDRMKFATLYKSHSDLKRLQQQETIKRYQFINDVLKVGLNIDTIAKDYRSKLDRVLTHKVWGYVIFFLILFIIFNHI